MHGLINPSKNIKSNMAPDGLAAAPTHCFALMLSGHPFSATIFTLGNLKSPNFHSQLIAKYIKLPVVLLFANLASMLCNFLLDDVH